MHLDEIKRHNEYKFFLNSASKPALQVKPNQKRFDNVTVCRIKCMYSGKYTARRIEEEQMDSARLQGAQEHWP